MNSKIKRPLISLEQVDSLRKVLLEVHKNPTTGKSEISGAIGLGRAVVSERVTQLMELGLIEQVGHGVSTGGRPSTQLKFNSSTGYLIVVDLGATGAIVAITDLTCSVLESIEENIDISKGPVHTLKKIDSIIEELISRFKAFEKIWGIGVGLPAPVEFSSGLPVSPPIMPGWDLYPVREYFEKRYNALTWVDNDVNLMALGEARDGSARQSEDSLFIKVGTGIGMGLVSQRQLHRGAQGAAGDIGHIAISNDKNIICKCGNSGCLEALAGGAAIARDGLELAKSGTSELLAKKLQKDKSITARDVAAASQAGCSHSLDLIASAGRTIGTTLAGLVNFYNPELVIIGGGVSLSGNSFLATIRESIYRRSLPLATKNLQIVLPLLGSQCGVVGGAHMVIEELFSPRLLGKWINNGSPIGMLEIRE